MRADCSEPVEICPDDYQCYHGECNDGHCDCDKGYTGDDCSLGPFYDDEPCPAGKAGSKACLARAAAARHSSRLVATAEPVGGRERDPFV